MKDFSNTILGLTNVDCSINKYTSEKPVIIIGIDNFRLKCVCIKESIKNRNKTGCFL